MKLKTLQDFDNKFWAVDGYNIILRQEAIKHIKSKIIRIEEHSHKKFDWDRSYMDCIQCRNLFVQIAWIRYFFNITKEDLRGLEEHEKNN